MENLTYLWHIPTLLPAAQLFRILSNFNNVRHIPTDFPTALLHFDMCLFAECSAEKCHPCQVAIRGEPERQHRGWFHAQHRLRALLQPGHKLDHGPGITFTNIFFCFLNISLFSRITVTLTLEMVLYCYIGIVTLVLLLVYKFSTARIRSRGPLTTVAVLTP